MFEQTHTALAGIYAALAIRCLPQLVQWTSMQARLASRG